nr:zinc finger protein 865 [Vicugna pacos]
MLTFIQGHPELEAKNTDLRGVAEETLTFHLSGEKVSQMDGGPWAMALRCGACGKTFRYRSNLLEHQRLHLGERAYRCEHCGKGFFYLSSVLRHQRAHEPPRPELRCPACLKAFKDPGYFRKHLAAHQGGRPFRCSSCGEGFTNTYGLKKHRLVHKAEGLGAPGAGAGTLAGKDA